MDGRDERAQAKSFLCYHPDYVAGKDDSQDVSYEEAVELAVIATICGDKQYAKQMADIALTKGR